MRAGWLEDKKDRIGRGGQDRIEEHKMETLLTKRGMRDKKTE